MNNNTEEEKFILDDKLINLELLKRFNSSSPENKATSLLNYLESSHLFTKEDIKSTKVAIKILGFFNILKALWETIKNINSNANKLASIHKTLMPEFESTISKMAEEEVKKQLLTAYEFYLIKTSQEERRLTNLIEIYCNFVKNPDFISPVAEITMKSDLIQFALNEENLELKKFHIARLARIDININE